MTVSKEMSIGQVVSADPGCGEILMEYGMHCLWCPSATAESLEDACMVHGTNVDELVEKLNQYFADK